jgi:hypothetical protein
LVSQYPQVGSANDLPGRSNRKKARAAATGQFGSKSPA